MTLIIRDDQGKHYGKLRIGQATVEWCPGKTHMGNGKKVPLKRLLKEIGEM